MGVGQVAVECTYQRSNDEYQTPSWVKQGLFANWFDPCPLNSGAPLQDGLAIDWVDYTFVNPPYSQPLPWVEKAILENWKGKTIALLLKHDSSTKWYKLLHEAGAHFLMPVGRLHFSAKQAAPFPSIIAILHTETTK
ncbi:MAG: phage N-6-adenine-methyltransferase [Candidatus Bathyarchaeota archaeon]|nr:phage N-6-adenine-methyltransferase [Candidatus Termiticorpusculum sp.]